MLIVAIFADQRTSGGLGRQTGSGGSFHNSQNPGRQGFIGGYPGTHHTGGSGIGGGSGVGGSRHGNIGGQAGTHRGGYQQHGY